jgi:uncharacterized cupredoxin-like copper-binding protein
MVNSALKGTLAVAALALVLALVLASCGGGGAGSGGSSGGGGGGSGSSSSAATKSGATKSGATKSGATKSGASGGVIKTTVIKETEFKLSPSSVTLSKPGTYKFKAENVGSTQHSLEIEGKGVKGEAQLEQVLDPGQSGVLTVSFQKSGTYEMYCPVDGHEQEGMKGEVVVK